MASIYKRKDIWWIDIYENGKRIRETLYTSDKRIAERKLADRILLRQADKGGYAPDDCSFEGFKSKYLVYSKGEKVYNTHNTDKLAISRLIETFPIEKLSQITPQLLETLRYKWKEAGYSLHQINRHRNAIVAMMHWAERHGYIQKQSWEIVKRFKVTEARIEFFTIDELSTIIKKSKGDYKTSAFIQGRAGLRIGEVIHLEFNDLDFDRSRINIEAKEGWNPKTFQKRSIPMPEDLKGYLQSLPRLSKRVLVQHNWSMNTFAHMVIRELKRLGFEGSSHKFRHSYGAHLAMANVDMPTIAKWMGHSSSETTEKHYVHLSTKHQDEQILKLPALSL